MLAKWSPQFSSGLKLPKTSKSKKAAPPPRVRFPAMLRVDYEADGRSTFAYSTHLSSGELFLRPGKDFPDAQRVELRLTLGAKDKPLILSGLIELRGEGPEAAAVVVFGGDQEPALKQVRKYIEGQLVPKLEESLARALRPPEKVLDLAAWYCEAGREAEALALCRRAWRTGS